MFEVDPKSLVDSRIQLHLAAQLIGGAADAVLDKAEDDSHANIGWNAESQSLEGRAGVVISVADFTVHYGGESFGMQGGNLADAAQWLSGKLDAQVVFRGYEGMPEHAVQQGGALAPDPMHLSAIAKWFSFAQSALGGNGELRIWPHHFDMGFWQPSEVEGKSIGGGFSLGDNYYDSPYFYMNPYGVDRPDSLPSLLHGGWTEHWLGAVLTAAELQGASDSQQVASPFVSESYAICKALIG